MPSLEEHARQLLQLADDAPADKVTDLVIALEAWAAQANEILGNTASRDIIMGEVQAAVTVCDQLTQAIEILRAAAKSYGEQYLGGGS